MRDERLAGVLVRRYRPAASCSALLVYFHGGFWVLGDLDTHDRFCRRLAAEAGVEVVAVDYRLAPEHPWPAAVDDARAVVGALDAPVILAGDSAGGCVAALAAHSLSASGAVAGLVLICPNTDLTGAQPSMRETHHELDPRDVRWAAAQWMPDVRRHGDGDVSPLHAEHLEGMPPTVVVTAEQDPLRDEGRAYATRLEGAGVPVRFRCEAGLPHGFIQGLDVTDARAEAAVQRLFADVRALCSPPAGNGAGRG